MPTEKVTAGPWCWWTSCSFRRLSSDATGKDGDVAYAFVNRSDGHPDIQISEGDMTLIETAVNACFSINKDDPLAVAREIGEAFALLREQPWAMRDIKWLDRRNAILNRIGAKP